MFTHIPRIEPECILLFDGFAEQPETLEDGPNDSGPSGSAAGEKLDQGLPESVSIQPSAKIFVLGDELVRRRLVHLGKQLTHYY